LLDAKPVDVEGARVVVSFDPEFAGNKEKIEYSRNLKVINKVMSEILNREVAVEFRVLDAKATVPGDIKAKNMTSPETAPASESATEKPKGRSRSTQDWVKNPTVKKALELFNGDIVDVRE
ncbi:MAG: hypothetical protein KJ726_08220, partial [Verrucomicrobia bacterium]|nr:hypothetical protein [Verrucomicrobiota bacterium]